MSQIAYIANLWTLSEHPSAAKEWSLAKKIQAVADAGFDGITSRLTPDHRRLAEESGLKYLIGFISSSNPDDFAALLAAQKEAGAPRVNVHLDDDDTPPKVAVKHWVKLVKLAEKAGVLASLEIHRDTCTETPEKTYEIAERYQAITGQPIRFTLDFSHLAVVKHLMPDAFSERLLTHPALIQNVEQCHFRPFNGHHCQIPVTIRGQLTPEVISYLKFATDLMRMWRAGNPAKESILFACPEMGPTGPGGGYNISGLPPAWPDAIVLRQELAKAWKAAGTGKK